MLATWGERTKCNVCSSVACWAMPPVNHQAVNHSQRSLLEAESSPPRSAWGPSRPTVNRPGGPSRTAATESRPDAAGMGATHDFARACVASRSAALHPRASTTGKARLPTPGHHGWGGRYRTCDLAVNSRPLSLLSYTPVLGSTSASGGLRPESARCRGLRRRGSWRAGRGGFAGRGLRGRRRRGRRRRGSGRGRGREVRARRGR